MDENTVIGDTIPCEFCEAPIEQSEYMAHVSQCPLSTRAINIPISFYMNGSDEFDEVDELCSDDDDEDFYELARYVNSNRQISNGLNLRNFLEQHFNSVSRRSSPNSHTGQNMLMLRVPMNRNEAPRLTSYEVLSQLEKVEVGVSDINLVSNVVDVKDTEDTDVCPICQENLQEKYIEDSTNKYRKLSCNHVYCSECISKWLAKSKKCPVCKSDLEK